MSSEPTYPIAEIFTSIQGEGVHAGVPMTFIRTVGCSVGKRICHHCDTEFDKTYPWKGGGEFTPRELRTRIHARHVCITGGEPFNHDLRPLFEAFRGLHIHIETSGTVRPPYTVTRPSLSAGGQVRSYAAEDGTMKPVWLWVCVSPKPGYLDDMILDYADEVKIIVPGLGNGEGWPGLVEAKRYAQVMPTYLQPRNGRDKVDHLNLSLVMQLVLENPELRLSTQLHKFVNVR